MHHPQKPLPKWALLSSAMFSHTGPALALFLLCCMGTSLSNHQLPPEVLRKIIMELKYSSERFLEDYVKEEKGVPESHNYMLPCFTSDSQPPNNFDSLAVLRYFQKIRTFRNDTIIIEITEQLKKLKFQNTREIHVSVPKGAFERKRFILAIFKQFSKCMELMSKALNSEAQKGT